jgi:hypothetical protein
MVACPVAPRAATGLKLNWTLICFLESKALNYLIPFADSQYSTSNFYLNAEWFIKIKQKSIFQIHSIFSLEFLTNPENDKFVWTYIWKVP